MKKVIILLFIGLLFSCEKPDDKPVIDPNKGTAIFWTTEYMGWTFYVDDIEIGTVKKPYPINTTDQIPTCGNKQFTNLLLLKGRHYYHMELFIPTQPPPNHFITQTYYFDVVAGGCTVVRVTQ